VKLELKWCVINPVYTVPVLTNYNRLQKLQSQHLIVSLPACIGERTVPVSASFWLLSTRHLNAFKQCLALRRYGTFRRDLNEELIIPMTKTIASSWSKVFEADLFSTFEASITNSINKLVSDVEGSAATSLKDRVRTQGEACTEEAKAALKNIVEVVRETMNSEQKEVSRCLVPHIQRQLFEGYDTAMEERGSGSVARQKVNRVFFEGSRKMTATDVHCRRWSFTISWKTLAQKSLMGEQTILWIACPKPPKLLVQR